MASLRLLQRGQDREWIATCRASTFLRTLNLSTTYGKLLAEAVCGQEAELGDGTTSVLQLCIKLYDEAKRIMHSGVKLAYILDGYRLAAYECVQFLQAASQPIECWTGLTSVPAQTQTQLSCRRVLKCPTGSHDQTFLADLLAEAIETIKEPSRGSLPSFDPLDIWIIAESGWSSSQSSVHDGFLIPRLYFNHFDIATVTAVAFVSEDPFVTSQLQKNVKTVFETAAELRDWKKQQEIHVQMSVSRLMNLGVNLLLCGSKLSTLTRQYLKQGNVLFIDELSEVMLLRLCRLCNGRLVRHISDLIRGYIGQASKVHSISVGSKSWIQVIPLNRKSVSLLLRASNVYLVDELKRCCEQAIHSLQCLRRSNDTNLIPGGGSMEFKLYLHLQHIARTVSDSKRRAVEAFSNCVLSMAHLLIENTGADVHSFSMELLNLLQPKPTADNCPDISTSVVLGVSFDHSSPCDVVEKGILDFVVVRCSVYTTATDVVCTILEDSSLDIRQSQNHMLTAASSALSALNLNVPSIEKIKEKDWILNKLKQAS